MFYFLGLIMKIMIYLITLLIHIILMIDDVCYWRAVLGLTYLNLVESM